MSDYPLWKRLLLLAALCFLGTVLEVSLLYWRKRRGALGFQLNLRPDLDLFE